MKTTKVSLRIGGSSFDIELDSDFASSMMPELNLLFRQDTNNDTKLLLQAYIKKSYELYELKKSLALSIKKIDALNQN